MESLNPSGMAPKGGGTPFLTTNEDAVWSKKRRERDEFPPSDTFASGEASVKPPDWSGHVSTSENKRFWMEKLRKGDLSGLNVLENRYLKLRSGELVGNPRAEESYKDLCCEKVGLGPDPDRERYPHFQSQDDFALMRWVVRRSSGCFWVQDTQRTSVRAFKHA